MMESREYLNSLFDIYKELLTEVEQETFINYYSEDLSLSEIAENRGISKSSVGKTLKQAAEKLEDYEKKLGIYQNKISLSSLLNEDDIKNIKEKLKKLL